MRKITLFVEGQTEAAVIKRLLLLILKPELISITFLTLGSPSAKSPSDFPNTGAIINYLVINVGGDGNVMGVIKDREARLFQENTEKIIGLQDLKGQEYEKFSPGKINPLVTNKFISARQQIIRTMSVPSKVKFFFSIMEIEAWILSMPQVIYRIGNGITRSSVKKSINQDIEVISPEDVLYNPSSTLIRIYSIASKHYDKSLSCVLSLTEKISKEDVDELISSGKSSSFINFYNELIINNAEIMA